MTVIEVNATRKKVPDWKKPQVRKLGKENVLVTQERSSNRIPGQTSRKPKEKEQMIGTVKEERKTRAAIFND